MNLPELSLPTDDASHTKLPTELRVQVGERWRSRAQGELSTASAFTHVARQLMNIGAVPDVLWLAAKAVSDEVRHAEICRRVAEVYLGRTLELPQADSVELAQFGDADARVNALLLVVAHSCINEGIALAYLQEQLRLAESPLVRAAIQSLSRDDVDHARIGWAHLASYAVTSADKQHVARAMPVLLRLVTDLWLAPSATDVDCPEHGCLGVSRLPSIVSASLSELILPGFDYVGVDTSYGRVWFEERFGESLARKH